MTFSYDTHMLQAVLLCNSRDKYLRNLALSMKTRKYGCLQALLSVAVISSLIMMALSFSMPEVRAIITASQQNKRPAEAGLNERNVQACRICFLGSLYETCPLAQVHPQANKQMGTSKLRDPLKIKLYSSSNDNIILELFNDL